ncbi:MAG TPA: nitroreductase/quinone reductase family protein [Acidimicrobiales bacterium]|nr:nitroreductase/quinone reductase family protein [Acidimicrobiales bacterium]
MSADQQPARYVEPDRWTRRLLNPAVAWLTRRGLSVYGSRVLAVRSRTSGEWRTTPVNLLTVDGERYLVAPRGETQWVRNLRATGSGELRVGHRVEAFAADEVDDTAKPPLLRAYLRRWRFEVKTFFAGVGPEATDEELRRIAEGYPVFVVRPAA